MILAVAVLRYEPIVGVLSKVLFAGFNKTLIARGNETHSLGSINKRHMN